jgi:hypothetical protein
VASPPIHALNKIRVSWAVCTPQAGPVEERLLPDRRDHKRLPLDGNLFELCIKARG